MIKRNLLFPLSLAVAMVALLASSAFAAGVPTKTTLDACGYFYGYQTASHSEQRVREGVTHTNEHGTWVGVWNNYVNTPVASVSPVTGTYHDKHTRDAAGNISGTERFKSAKGNIDQVYAFNVSTGWHVKVVATDQLSFLTSDTNGHCYKGPWPRP